MDSNRTQSGCAPARSNSFPLPIWRLFLLVCLLTGSNAALADTFYVNSVGDLGDQTPGDGDCATGQFIQVGIFFGPECTLRAAIEEANGSAAPDTLAFALQLPKVAGVVEFQPTMALPDITTPILFDGYSAADYDLADPNARPIINLVGNLLPGYSDALHFHDGSSGSAVRGIAFHSFPGAAVRVETHGIGAWVDDFEIEGCHLGISRGVFYLGNGGSGLALSRTRNARVGRICNGGGCSGRRNVSAANTYMGISLNTSQGAIVQGNLLGTDLSGNLSFVPGGGASTNGFDGIRINGGSGHLIGGDTHPDSGNVISGNANYGVNITGDGHSVLGNRIGTNAAGTAALPNGLSGIRVSGEDNQIGSHTPYGRNVISGNQRDGVESIGGNRIVGNTIGLSADQMTPIGNEREGIDVSGSGALIEHNIVTMNGIPGSWSSVVLDGTAHAVYSNLIGTNEFGTYFDEGWSGIRIAGNHHLIGAAGRGNVTAFHAHGIAILAGAHVSLIHGNWIGTDASGADLGNVFGISVQSDFVQIGALDGLASGEGNVIANNDYNVHFAVWSIGNILIGNRIGPDTPVTDPADSQIGVYLLGSDNVIGGGPGMSAEEVALAGNLISNNPGGGIMVENIAAGNTLRGNRVSGHVDQPAVDLAIDGASPNDDGDADLGANQMQNSPQFNLAQTEINEVTGELEVRYRVASDEVESAYPLTIDFYLRSTYDAEADVYIGSDSYSAVDARRYRSVAIEPLESSLPLDGVLVATATDSDGNTSELSRQWVPVPEPGYGTSVIAGAGFASLLAARRRIG